MLYRYLVYLIFFFMVVLPIYIERESLPERVKIIRENIKYSLFSPLVFIILIVFAIAAFYLSEYVTILKFGWLGENIVAAPVSDTSETIIKSSRNSDSTIPIISIVVFSLGIFTMLLAMLIFNYDEEEFFRDSYSKVVIWALLHLIMGIPIFAVIPIFATGVVYKKIKDKYGLEAAFVSHFFTNFLLITIIVGTIVLATLI